MSKQPRIVSHDTGNSIYLNVSYIFYKHIYFGAPVLELFNTHLIAKFHLLQSILLSLGVVHGSLRQVQCRVSLGLTAEAVGIRRYGQGTVYLPGCQRAPNAGPLGGHDTNGGAPVCKMAGESGATALCLIWCWAATRNSVLVTTTPHQAVASPASSLAGSTQAAPWTRRRRFPAQCPGVKSQRMGRR